MSEEAHMGSYEESSLLSTQRRVTATRLLPIVATKTQAHSLRWRASADWISNHFFGTPEFFPGA